MREYDVIAAVIRSGLCHIVTSAVKCIFDVSTMRLVRTVSLRQLSNYRVVTVVIRPLYVRSSNALSK